MRAAVLNSAKMGAGPEPGNPNVIATETVPGGTVVTGQPARRNGFDIEKAKGFWQSGEKLAQAGKANGMTVNPGAMLTAAATGAAAGVGIAGVGAVLGAVIAVGIYLVGALFGGNRPSRWDNAGPGVHAWFTNYGPQAYLYWVESTGNTGVLASVKDAVKGMIVWRLTVHNNVLFNAGAWYNGINDETYILQAYRGTDAGLPYEAAYQLVAQIYADMGVDWSATVGDYVNGTAYDGTLRMINRKFLPGEPTEAEIEAAADAGNSTGAGPVLAATSILVTLAAALNK
jgi:hypothetical protein